MMPETNTPSFEATWADIRTLGQNDAFEFIESTARFSKAVSGHFAGGDRDRRQGVYVVRNRTNEVVYIGKAGTVRKDGTFKGQDLPGRLRAPRGGDERGDDWFAKLGAQSGPLRVEYVFLGAQPCSPALAEARLLQAFLNETGKLPEHNKAL